MILVRKNKRIKLKLKKKKYLIRSIKLLKWKKLNDNKNIIQKKKIMLNFLLRWNNFINETFFNNKKLIKKRKISIGSYSMRCINKNVVVFIDIFKNKRKFRRIKRMPTDYWYTALLRRFRKQKSLSKVYKKVNNTLLNIKIKQNWIKMNQAPVFFKTIHAFAYNSKGWRKILRVIRNSYNLQRFNKNIYFENTLFNTLISCHFKNPGSLTKNLGENLRKQWKHRQQLFFLYYLLMSILWHFKLKKVTSFQKIKTIYMMIRGKINSGTRTKYFQIKAPYKASFMTRQNHMTFAKGVARAKTGIFGIKSWIHY